MSDIPGVSLTENYELLTFDDTQTTLTFKDFREKLAGNHGNDEANYSNIEKIDQLFKQCSEAIQNCFDTIEETSATLTQNYQAVDDLIRKDDDSILIGGSDGQNIKFNDGNNISEIKNGTFYSDGISVNNAKICDYVIKCKHYSDTNKHLQFIYKPELEV